MANLEQKPGPGCERDCLWFGRLKPGAQDMNRWVIEAYEDKKDPQRRDEPDIDKTLCGECRRINAITSALEAR